MFEVEDYRDHLLHRYFGPSPKGWSTIRVGDIFEERHQHNADLGKHPLHSFTIENGVTPKTERYERSFLLRDKEKNEYKLVHPNDFVVNPMNVRFGAISYSKLTQVVSVSAYYDVLKIKCEGHDIDFLEAFLSSRAMLKIYNRVAIGSLIEKRRVHYSEFKDLKIFCPSHEEEREIGEVIRCWNARIQATERILTVKIRRKHGLMQRLLTGKQRFQKFVQDRGRFPTKFGTLPNDWSYVHIGDIARDVCEKNTSHRELKVLSCTKHRGLVESLSYFAKRVFSEDLSTYKIVSRGQFAYATNHIEEGSIGYQNLCDEALISPMYTVFETNARVDHSFLYKLLKTELYRHMFEVNTSASVDRRGSLRWREFAKIRVALPSLEEQRCIAAVLDSCDREIILLKMQIAALKRQKRGLIEKLLTGQIRAKARDLNKEEFVTP